MCASKRDVHREFRARALCYGLQADAAAQERLWATYGFRKGFVQGAVFRLSDGHILNTAVFADIRATVDAPLLTWNPQDSWTAFCGESIVSCEPVHQPPAVNVRLPDGRIGADYAMYHASNLLFVTPVRECAFGASNVGCDFCTYHMAPVRPLDVDVLVSLLDGMIEARQDPAPLHLSFGGGTPNLNDYGVRYYAKLCSVVKRRYACSVSVELVPPPRVDDLAILVDAGADALIMSLELWDDGLRRRLAPGKGRISRAHYYCAWESALELLGPGSVASVLLVGLEPEVSTCAGVDGLIHQGVIPTLIPFRPYGTCELHGLGLTDHESYIRCSEYAVGKLRAGGLNPSLQAGCTGCSGCSMEGAIIEGPGLSATSIAI
jgi:hypothetical protein